MKLELLQEISETISREFDVDGIACCCYYYFEQKWHSATKSDCDISQEETSALSKSVSEPVAYHAPNSTSAWFYFQELQATYLVEFPSSPKYAKRKKTRDRIVGAITNATNAFKVSHNDLTGLLSRDAFRNRLNAAIANVENRPIKGFIAASEGQSLQSVSTLAFDIDKFKQVNDTYGHLYGDQVLKTFARRLEETRIKAEQEYGPNVKITLGHPSGEEFLALVEGSLSNDDLKQIADIFRLSISEEPLPTDEEWSGLLSLHEELQKVQFPPKSGRQITTSVGVASHATSEKLDESAFLVLLDRADVALYKSKSSGRDCVTLFDDIINNCGRVLEHDQCTGVVAIDIGSKVGVSVGQEFRVFPSSYCGKTAYTIDDGRTRKTLGYYPKIELCRIVVFDSQSDISFANISTQFSTEKLIGAGSTLEVVPLGTITHLISSPQRFFGAEAITRQQNLDILGGAELQARVDKIVEADNRPVAFSLRFKHEAAFYKKYGSAVFNRALAQLFSRVRELYSTSQNIGLVDTTAICVVTDSKIFDLAELQKFVTSNYPPGDELEIVCGYYDSSEVDCDKLVDKHAIELARYALSDKQGLEQVNIQKFSSAVAERIIAQHRNLRNYNNGIADYINLKDIGIVSADIENYAGLCYSSAGDDRHALECYLRATELEPRKYVFRGNAVILAARNQEFELALRLMYEFDLGKIKSLATTQPNALWTSAFALATAKKNGLPNYRDDYFRVIGPAALALKDSHTKRGYDLVRSLVEIVTPRA